MASIRKDPLDDMVVRTWDAFVSRTNAGGGIDPQVFDLVGKFTDLSEEIEPDPTFLRNLESQLFGASDNGTATTAAMQANGNVILPPRPPIPLDSRRRWLDPKTLLDRLSIAALLAVLLAGVAVLYFANRSGTETTNNIPAVVDSRDELEQALNPPGLETLLNIEIDPATLNGPAQTDWKSFGIYQASIDPEIELSSGHPYFKSSLFVSQVIEGQATITSGNGAVIYRSGSGDAESMSPGIAAELGIGDAVVYSSASETVIRSAGTGELQMMTGRAIETDNPDELAAPPNGYTEHPTCSCNNFEPFDATSIDLRLERVILNPESMITVESSPDERLYGWYPEQATSGARFLPGNESSFDSGMPGEFLGSPFTLHNFPPGPYTILNPDDEPLTLYFMRLVGPEQSTDATPEAVVASAETLLSIPVSPFGLDAQTAENWDRTEFALVTVKTGETFTTDHPYFSCCAGIMVFQVQQGSASLIVDGAADLYAAVSGQPPSRVPAGTLVAFEAGESAVFGMEHPAVVTNTGVEDLVMLGGYGYEAVDNSGPVTVPEGYAANPSTYEPNFDPLPAGDVAVSFERVSLEPGSLTHFDFSEGELWLGWTPETNTIVRRMDGARDSIPADNLDSFMVQAIDTNDFPAGTYTFYNAGRNLANFYIMRIASVDSVTSNASPVASPVAVAQEAETLLDIQVNPGDLGATTSDLWDTQEFALVHVKPGESFSTDHPYFTCCAGAAVFQVQEGSASFIVESVADLYSSDSGQTPSRIPAGTLFPLETGETAVLVMNQPAIVTNTGTEELVMLGAYGYQFIGPGTMISPDGYEDQPVLADSGMDPLPGDEVQVQLERIALEPGELTHIESSPESRLAGWYPETNTVVRMAKGELDTIPESSMESSLVQTFAMNNFSPGVYSFFNVGDHPATLYLMRMTPSAASATPATPVSEASPVAMQSEPVAFLDLPVDPATINAPSASTWTRLESYLVRLLPGESINTDEDAFTCCPGLQLFSVLSGSADMQIYGPAIVDRDGSQPFEESVGTESPVIFSEGESVAFSTLTPAMITNNGSEELLLISGNSDQYNRTDASSVLGFDAIASAADYQMEPVTTDEALITLERIEIGSGQLVDFEIDSTQRLVGWTNASVPSVRLISGSHDTPPDDAASSPLIGELTMKSFPTGPYSLFNEGDDPVTFYFMRLSPWGAPAAETSLEDSETTASSQQLASFLADPASLSIGGPDVWSNARFELSYLEAGERLDGSGAEAQCCDSGLAALHVLEGSLEIELVGPAQIAESMADLSPEVVELSGSTTLEASNTIWYSLDAQPVISNPGEAQVAFLSMAAYADATPGTEDSLPNLQPISATYSAAGLDLDPGPVSTSFGRVEVGPLASVPLQNVEGEPVMVLLEEGSIDFYPDIGGPRPTDETLIDSRNAGEGFSFEGLQAGAWIAQNMQDTPAIFYVGRLTSDLPVRVNDAAYDTVFSAVVKPSVHSFGNDPGWNEAYFAEATLEPHASVSSTDPRFGCCNGLQFVTVVEGELTVQSNRLISAQLLGVGGSDPGAPLVLQPGESAVYEDHLIATNSGSEQARFLIGGVYRAEPSTEEFDLETGFRVDARAISSFTFGPDDPLQRIDIDRVTIVPGESVPLTVTPDDALILIAEGDALQLTDASGQPPIAITETFSGAELDPGEYELRNVGSTPVTVLTLRIGPDQAPPTV